MKIPFFLWRFSNYQSCELCKEHKLKRALSSYEYSQLYDHNIISLHEQTSKHFGNISASGGENLAQFTRTFLPKEKLDRHFSHQNSFCFLYNGYHAKLYLGIFDNQFTLPTKAHLQADVFVSIPENREENIRRKFKKAKH